MDKALSSALTFLLIVMLQLPNISKASAVNFRLNPSGIKILNDVGFREVSRTKDVQLEDFSGWIQVQGGFEVFYNLTNNVIAHFEFLGNTSTHAITPDYLLAIGNGAFVRVRGKLHMRLHSPGRIELLEMLMTDYDAAEFSSTTAVAYELSVANGYLMLRDADCFHRTGTFYATNFDSMLGPSSKALDDILKVHISQQVCKSFIPRVTWQLNQIFSQTPSHIDVMQAARISFALLPDQLEIVDNEYVLVNVSGEVYRIGQPGYRYSHRIGKLPAFSSTSRMTQVLISNYVMKALLHSLHDAQVFSFESGFPDIFGISPTLLLSTYIPGFRQYSDRPLKLAVRSSVVPELSINENVVTILGRFDIGVVVGLDANQTFEALTASANFTGNADVTMMENTVVIVVDDVSIDLALTESNVGSFESETLLELFQNLLPGFITPTLNDILQPGFSLTNLLSMELYNMTVMKRKDALEILADLRIA